MSYIYVITNDVNGKQYVGKTNWTIEKRFKEHLNDRLKRSYEKRPLYDAMNKYGVEHFSIEQLEQCSVENVDNREKYWINKLNTYNNGYNATLGGDGTILYNYKKLADKYLELKVVTKVADFFNCDVETVRKACLEYNIEIEPSKKYIKEKYGKQVIMLPEKIIFASLNEAGNYLIDNNIAKTTNVKGVVVHIRNVCNGKKEKAYGHNWQFI